MDGPAFAWHVGELVKLRDANKRDLVLPNTAETRAMRRDVAEINEMLAGLNVILEGFPDQGGLVWMETTKGKPHPVYTHQNQLSRTFKYDLIPPSGMPDSRWGFPSGPISDSMW